LKVNEEKKQDPYSLVKGMDPRIQIHTKMSWIRNTGRKQSWQLCHLRMNSIRCMLEQLDL
jgi:hypothetical protein